MHILYEPAKKETFNSLQGKVLFLFLSQYDVGTTCAEEDTTCMKYGGIVARVEKSEISSLEESVYDGQMYSASKSKYIFMVVFESLLEFCPVHVRGCTVYYYYCTV